MKNTCNTQNKCPKCPISRFQCKHWGFQRFALVFSILTQRFSVPGEGTLLLEGLGGGTVKKPYIPLGTKNGVKRKSLRIWDI